MNFQQDIKDAQNKFKSDITGKTSNSSTSSTPSSSSTSSTHSSTTSTTSTTPQKKSIEISPTTGNIKVDTGNMYMDMFVFIIGAGLIGMFIYGKYFVKKESE